MSTIVYIPDDTVTTFQLNNSSGSSPIEFFCWDGSTQSADDIRTYLNSSSGTNLWPAPTIDQSTGTLNFASFIAADSTPIAAFDFPLGSIIVTGSRDTTADFTQPVARSYFELHGTIRTEY